jgi:small subunit ribosomal protein S6
MMEKKMKKERRRLYEGIYIISTTLSDDARKKALDKIVSGITDKGGEIRKLHEWGRRKLAYTINKKREGYYYVIYFDIASSQIASLWNEYHLHEDLLRFMTMQAETVLEKLEFKSVKLERERV